MSWFRPDALLLPSMLAINARHLGAKTGVIVGENELSWREFVDQCATFGGALAESGLVAGDRVGIVMDNALETLLAMFGTIYAGCVAVPINVSVADEAIAGMLVDSDAKAVVCNGAHIARVDTALASDRVALRVATEPFEGWQSFDRFVAAAGPLAEPAVVSAESECNIIYSSGTTGLPKGIVHDHRCRAAWAYDMAVALRYHPGARTLGSLGLYSNITWVAMLATIVAGGTIVVMPRFETGACLDLIESAGITHATMVPVQLQRLLDDPGFRPSRVASMQSLMCCGSPLAPVIKQRVVDGFGGAFMELYGLTEGLVTVLQPEEMENKLTSVGRPCAGQQIVVLDGNDQVCPAGVSGEIVGYGPLQMAGYHNREDANDEATWLDDHGRRWLRTGDIGRFDRDGFLYLVDRKKDMIISGGQNVYPADIEAVVAGHEQVREVAVIGAQSERWGETPLAVVVGDIGAPDQFVQWVNQRVGKQQRIAGVRTVAALPRNPNGKVLKRELRELFSDVRF